MTRSFAASIADVEALQRRVDALEADVASIEEATVELEGRRAAVEGALAPTPHYKPAALPAFAVGLGALFVVGSALCLATYSGLHDWETRLGGYILWLLTLPTLLASGRPGACAGGRRWLRPLIIALSVVVGLWAAAVFVINAHAYVRV